MFRLAEKVGRDPVRIVGGIGDHQNFGWSGNGIDSHLPEDFPLGGRDPGIARSHDLVHRRNALRAVSERRDSLGAADAENIADPCPPRRRQHQRIEVPTAGRRDHHDAGHARNLGGDRVHQDR